ncbi:hypothetical protein Bbelb_401290 [Branchiostoma belcheri]|nr:hypothetical protein Bbelb_401290 [Branchiostoma belcheri]
MSILRLKDTIRNLRKDSMVTVTADGNQYLTREESEEATSSYFVWRRRGVSRSSIAALLCVEKKRSIPIFNSSVVMCGEEEEYSDLQEQLCYVWRRRGVFRYSIAAVMCGEEEEYSDLQKQLCYVWRRRGVFRSSIAAVLCVEKKRSIFRSSIAAVLCVEKKRSIPIFNSRCVMCGEEEEYSDLQ